MKIYNTPTQEDYDALMSELEVKGHKWLSGYKPTSKNYWEQVKENTCIVISAKYITFRGIEQCKKQHPNIPIIEYKAKGENMTEEKMTQEEMKQKEMKRNLLDRPVAVESFYRDIKFEMKTSTVEPDLQEAKTSAKKLIEKIDEYLESQKPKFKVGDYVTVYVNNKRKTAKIEKIDKIWEHTAEAHGLWYDQTKVNVKQDFWFISKVSKCRYATPTEILEYEMALAFHKHGRKPFEVKRGDIVYLKGYDKNIFLDSGNIYKKHNFIDGDVGLVKTVEEVNEWLENK